MGFISVLVNYLRIPLVFLWPSKIRPWSFLVSHINYPRITENI